MLQVYNVCAVDYNHDGCGPLFAATDVTNALPNLGDATFGHDEAEPEYRGCDSEGSTWRL